MGLFVPRFGLAKDWGGVERELKRRGPVEILVVQSVGHPVSRQVQEGFQERLMEEEELGFKFWTYNIKRKLGNIKNILQ